MAKTKEITFKVDVTEKHYKNKLGRVVKAFKENGFDNVDIRYKMRSS